MSQHEQRPGRTVRVATIAFICLSAHVYAASNNADHGIVSAPAFSKEQLAAAPTTGWMTNGGNLFNQRYSPLSQINRDNIRTLKAQWRTHLNGSGDGPSTPGRHSRSCTQGCSTS